MVGSIEAVNEVRVNRGDAFDVITVVGEFDLSNVNQLEEALADVLSEDPTASCLLDLSAVTFMDSSVVGALVRWSKEAQVSEREALAIMVGARDTPAARVLSLIGVMDRLAVFDSAAAASDALRVGKKPRAERPLEWLTDLELAAEREQAQAGSDAATRRLDEAIAEQDARKRNE
jgi:anti-anti-sigma factor